MDIQKEIEISQYQPTVFLGGTEMSKLYKAMMQHWFEPGEQNCGAVAASLFYGLGRVQGIREERARRRGKQRL